MDKDAMEVASIAAGKIELRDKMIEILILNITKCPSEETNCPDSDTNNCIKCWRKYAENKAKEKL